MNVTTNEALSVLPQPSGQTVADKYDYCYRLDPHPAVCPLQLFVWLYPPACAVDADYDRAYRALRFGHRNNQKVFLLADGKFKCLMSPDTISAMLMDDCILQKISYNAIISLPEFKILFLSFLPEEMAWAGPPYRGMSN